MQSSLPFANVDNSHIAAPIMSSKVGPVQGCGGPPNSPDALKQDGVFQMASSTGGKYKKRKSSKRRRHHSRRRHMKKRTHKRRRHHRGGQAIDVDAEHELLQGQSGTTDITSVTNTTSTASFKGGKSRRKRSSRHRKSRKHTRKHRRRRSSRRMKGGDGVYAAALTPSYSTPGVLDSSALASPPPIVRTNNCLDTYKHLGDTPPYNEEWRGIN